MEAMPGSGGDGGQHDVTEVYHWVKALHVISVIAWMAGLLYLPRLFVYHVAAENGSDKAETFKIMERRLLRAIMTPAMLASWLFGLTLLYLGEAWREPWMVTKLVMVLAMTGLHMVFARWRKDFEADRNQRSARFFRVANELPTLLMIIIVILAIVQPF
jgi:putative membrane protein